MSRRFYAAAFSALLLTGAGALAQSPASNTTWTIDSNHSQVDFQIRHLGVSKVHGSIGGVTGSVTWDEGDPGRSSVRATVKTSTVTTGNQERDTHLRSADFFNAERYPTMTFQSTAVTQAKRKLQVVGNLTLNGVTRSETLEVDGPTAPRRGPDGKTVTGFSATGKLNRSDFNFGQKYTAPLIGDGVSFTIDVEANR